MHRLETIDLGPYRGRNYFLTGFVEPSPADGADYDPGEDADEYGVVLALSKPFESNVEIVRMDTAHGQGPHLDRLYLSPDADADTKVDLDEDFSYGRMKQYLLANWRRFADLYARYNE